MLEPSQTQVLVVDDDQLILLILSQMLESAGYAVRTVSGAEQALAEIEAHCPHFLLTDWVMKGMDGPSLCQAVRRMSLPHYVYMLLLTGKSSAEDVVAGLDAGADDFLTKPVSPAHLLARMRSGERVLELERQLSVMAWTDPLTGLATRRSFYKQIEQEFARASRHHSPLSCVMLDVDNFKKINDTHGHPVGDAVLKAMAGVLQQNIRASDGMCRYGGEEFCAILPETNEHNATIWAERIRAAINALNIPVNDKQVRITASFGVAELTGGTKTAAELVDLADQALLVAKRSGRDRVVRQRDLYSHKNLPVAAPLSEVSVLDGVLAKNVMSPIFTPLNEWETVGDAAEFFLRCRVTSTPIVDGEGKLVGVISEKDVLCLMTQADSWQRSIREVMKKDVVWYEEDAPVLPIYNFLCRVSIRRAIIVKSGHPVGVISASTLIRWFRNWLAIHAAPSASPAHAVPIQRRQDNDEAIVRAAGQLAQRATTLHRRLEDGVSQDDYMPLLIDQASQMQDLIDGLLACSRKRADRAQLEPPTESGEIARPALVSDLA